MAGRQRSRAAMQGGREVGGQGGREAEKQGREAGRQTSREAGWQGCGSGGNTVHQHYFLSSVIAPQRPIPFQLHFNYIPIPFQFHSNSIPITFRFTQLTKHSRQMVEDYTLVYIVLLITY